MIKVVVHPSARIIIAGNVRLNSNKRNSHVSMYDCTRLMADRPLAQISIGSQTRINGASIHAYSQISVGKRCLIAPNTQIIDGNGHDLSFSDVENRINTIGGAKPIIIEDDVWIGANCVVLGGVVIGKGSVIGAGSVVDTSIPPMVLAKGNPVRIVKDYRKPETG